MTAPAAPRGIEALDTSLPVLEARLRNGLRAEFAHLLHDADPDSKIPAFVDLAKGVRLEAVR